MRLPVLLLLATASLPVASKADTIIDVSWDTMQSTAGADPFAALYNVNTPVSQFRSEGQDFWHLDSITVDGLTVMNPTYTPDVSDFTLTIRTVGGGPYGTNAVVGSANASAVGSLVSNGDQTSRFTITFDTITGQPATPFQSPFQGLMGGTYAIYIGLSNTSTINPFEFYSRGFILTQPGPSGFTEIPGNVAGVYLGSHAPVKIDATNPFAASVPEPSTYGLMLGGLALVGAAIVRRRKAKA
jgi:hypothetical protein